MHFLGATRPATVLFLVVKQLKAQKKNTTKKARFEVCEESLRLAFNLEKKCALEKKLTYT